MNIVILAAGQGKRMFSSLPKVLHPIAGKPMLEHVIERALGINSAKITVVLGHAGSAVQSFLQDKAYPVQTVEQVEQKGTGHAVLQAVDHLDEQFNTLVLYGDVPLLRIETLQRLVKLAEHGALALLTQILDDPTGYGRILRNADDSVCEIVEEKDASDSIKAIREINTGVMVVPTKALKKWLTNLKANNAQGEYYLTDIVAMASADGLPVLTVQPEFAWETSGVNSRVQLAQLERVWQNEIAQSLMSSGVTLVDPSRLDVRGHLSCEKDVTIDVGCVFEGNVRIAQGALIGPYCVIKNSSIGPGVVVHAYTHMDGASVGAKSVIGPYARLRPGTELAEEVHIGNFVEVKNSQIASQSKANHLAYVGDATVGSRVNVGAGTITCNYDGANKHRTIIEDDVFIGSDTQLIAPVRVEKGATLGAGTTLTKDAPADQLTVTRVKQTSIKWQRPVKKSK